MKKHKWDILLALGLLLAAGLLYMLLRPDSNGSWVAVSIGGNEIARYPLSEDRTVILGDEEYNVLQISDGCASIIDANCDSQLCVHASPISRSGELIVCLPHRLVLEIQGRASSPLDAVTG